jgi:Tol biopolymer transport system component
MNANSIHGANGAEKLAVTCLRRWRWAALLILIAGLNVPVIAQPLQLVSALDPLQAPPAGGGGDSWSPIFSPDARFVLFASTANNLVLTSNANPIPASFPPIFNVFLRDRTNATTTLVSVNLSGTAGGNGDSTPSGLSANGRYVLFESSASDLFAHDTNGATDVFVRDMVNGTNMLASVSTNRGVGNRASRSAVMTPDGRYVAFVSEANNLVPNDTNGIPDVFVRDLQAGSTTLVSVGATSINASAGTVAYLANAGSSEAPDITPDGRYVAFSSGVTNLVPGVTTTGDIYVRDLVNGTTTWASGDARAALNSGATNVVCYNQALSADGQYVAYQASTAPGWPVVLLGTVLRYSLQTGLTDVVNTNASARPGTPEDLRSLEMTPDGRFIAFIANSNDASRITTCVELWDAQTAATTLVSGDLSNNISTGFTCAAPAIDPTGRFVVFRSSAPNLVTNPLTGQYHVYVRDTQAGTTTLVNADPNGVGSAVSPIAVPQMNADGRYVVFEAPDGSLVPNDRNRADDVFLRDMVSGTNELISARDPALPTLAPNGASWLSTASLSANGQFVAFASNADNLVPGDTNGYRDIFVHDLVAGTNALVSVAPNGVGANGISTDSAISGDGRYVAFASSAANLVPGDANGYGYHFQQVFVRDLQSGTTALVSRSCDGTGSADGASYSPSLSSDGRFVLFRSLAWNLVSGWNDLPRYENLFLRDLLLSTNYALTHLTGSSISASSMARDGRFVAFSGIAAPLSSTCLCVWDSQLARLVCTNALITGISNVAVSADGNRIAYATGSALCVLDRAASITRTIATKAFSARTWMRFSGDGRFLAYVAPLTGTNQVYLYDFQTTTTLLVSTNYTSGRAAYGASDSPDISADGRFVAYRSAAGNLVPFDTNGVPDVFLYDRLNGTTTLLSASRLGTGATETRSLTPVFSADGQTLMFESWGADMVAQDFNQVSDVFAYSLYSSGQIPLFSAKVLCGSGPGSAPWITWPVVPGKTYHVQFKSTVQDVQWQDLNGAITIVGNQGCLNDLSAGNGPRFYRVVAY